jgi:hypothetical protein
MRKGAIVKRRVMRQALDLIGFALLLSGCRI